MWSDFINQLTNLIPTRVETILLTVSSAVVGWSSFAIGEIDLSVKWLFVFVVIDYATGMLAASKTGQWSSRQGFAGILKKVSIFVIVCICHGVDVICQVDFLRSSAIIAYALNEVGSVFENIERMGYGHLIPAFVQKSIKLIQDKENKKLEGIDMHDKTNRD